MTGSRAQRVVPYERWVLRDHVAVDDVVSFVRARIVPIYEQLSDDVALGLEVAADGRSVLAIQRWRSRRALHQAVTGPRFDQWLRSALSKSAAETQSSST